MVSNDEIKRQLRNKRKGTVDGGNKCPSCGSDNPAGSKFCQECGTTLTVSTDTTEAATESAPETTSRSPDKSSISSGTSGGSTGRTPGSPGTSGGSTGRTPGTSIGSSGETPGSPGDKGRKSFWRRIPGFRSHTTWKMILSSAVYLIVLFFIVVVVIGSILPSTPTIEVAGAPVTLVNNNSSTVDGMMINATLKSNGNLTILPVGVYEGSKYLGTFIMTNITPNREFSFRINVNDSNSEVMIIKTSTGKDLDFYPLDNSTSYSFSQLPGQYKLVIGDPNANITSTSLGEFLSPVVNSYNKSKGTQSDKIKLQGLVIGDYNALTNVSLYTNLTIILKLDEGKLSQGERVYESSGNTVTAWRYYEDVIVIYWPEMKVAGWHRIMGSAVPDTGYGTGGDIYGDPVLESDITDWINSLPKV